MRSCCNFLNICCFFCSYFDCLLQFFFFFLIIIFFLLLRFLFNYYYDYIHFLFSILFISYLFQDLSNFFAQLVVKNLFFK